MNIYVGNLPDAVAEQDLRKLFEKFGEILSINIIKDRATGTPRGFGFVEMYDKAQAESAIAGLNGTSLLGKPIAVKEAKPKEQGGGKSGPQGRGSVRMR
jgi:RNA recognition motif-containing protein